MRLTELAALYALVGVGCALSTLLIRRKVSLSILLDTALVGTLWPLYGPFLLFRMSEKSQLQPPLLPDQSLQSALQRASGTPLASLLPDRDSAQALQHRLSLAQSRVSEINNLLAQPDFCEEAAQARQQELAQRGDKRAAATAQRRVQSIGRLRQLRDSFSRELSEISELLVQLRIQAEVVRLSGTQDNPGDLMGELVLRLQSLDEMLSTSQHLD